MSNNEAIYYVSHSDTQRSVGQAVHVFNTVRELRKLGCRVLFFCPKYGDNPSMVPSSTDNRFIRLPKIKYVKHALLPLAMFFRMALEMSSIPPRFVYIRYTLLSAAPVVLCLIRGIPFYIERNDFTPHMFEKLLQGLYFVPKPLRFLLIQLEIWAMKKAHIVFCDTITLKNNLLTAYKINPARIVVNPNGVDPSVFTPEENGTKTDVPVVGFIGLIRHWQGLDHLVEAALLLKREGVRVSYQIVGDGLEMPELRSKIRSCGMETEFELIGSVPYNRIPEMIQNFDIGVAPYKSYFDGSGIKIFEYMACGKPVVASAISGVRCILAENEVGLSVSPEDPCELAVAIKRLALDRGLRRRLGKNARLAVVQKYSWEANTKKIIQNISESLSYENVGDSFPA